jgi:hypothetical protein
MVATIRPLVLMAIVISRKRRLGKRVDHKIAATNIECQTLDQGLLYGLGCPEREIDYPHLDATTNLGPTHK